jgi:hypothetical protein
VFHNLLRLFKVHVHQWVDVPGSQRKLRSKSKPAQFLTDTFMGGYSVQCTVVRECRECKKRKKFSYRTYNVKEGMNLPEE